MCARPLFVRYTPVRTARRHLGRLSAQRRALLGPAMLAVALAVAGRAVLPVDAAPVVSFAGIADRPDRAPGAPVTTRSNTIVRTVPEHRAAAPARKRASRSAPRRAGATGWVRPANGPLTSPYGYRWGRLHAGIDLGAPYGSPIYAAAAGVVTYVGPMSGYGTLVTIRHGDGTVTAYGHMSRYATRTGQHVNAGQVIAYVGAEGDATGPHLHFEVRVGGRAIDPRPFLRARGIFV